MGIRYGLLILVAFGLAACGLAASGASARKLNAASRQTAAPADLPDYGEAPELTNDVWLNTDQPLRLADLRGKVVLLDMWTFGCINCQHVIPSLKDWYTEYADQGLVVIGNHYPEFAYEAQLDNLKSAVEREEILYPVAQDNQGETWQAYRTQYWPTMYLIDKQGHLRYEAIGEGNYEQTEAAIQALLREQVGSGS